MKNYNKSIYLLAEKTYKYVIIRNHSSYIIPFFENFGFKKMNRRNIINRGSNKTNIKYVQKLKPNNKSKFFIFIKMEQSHLSKIKYKSYSLIKEYC